MIFIIVYITLENMAWNGIYYIDNSNGPKNDNSNGQQIDESIIDGSINDEFQMYSGDGYLGDGEFQIN